MIANLLIVVFVLGMAYIWSVYGLFSAFLQLILVIAAGAVALAVWEPLTVGFLLGRMPAYAWGVGLLGPFVLCLIVFRAVCDVIVRKNVQFPRLIHTTGGAACGLLSGILIAGLTWVGLNFLPLDVAVGGVQPYARNLSGQIVPADSGGLWVDVDTMAVGFFNGLSGGAFSTSKPLHLYQPDLAFQAAIHRLHTDPNASLVARPSGVKVTAAYLAPTPIEALAPVVAEAFGPQVNSPDHQLVVVDTEWSLDPGTYDNDSAVRIAPSQVWLVGFEGPDRAPEPVMLPPRGYSVIADFRSGDRTFRPLDDDQADVRSNQQSETFGFVFLVPSQVKLDRGYVLIRHLRMDLPQPGHDPQQFMQALGTPPQPQLEPAQEDATAAEPSQPGRQAGTKDGAFVGTVADEISQTASTPMAFNRNNASALSYQDTAVTGGDAVVSGRASGLATRTRVDRVFVPAHQSPIRMKLSADSARGIFGRALGTARAQGGVWLVDERGQQWRPFAWILHKGGDEQVVHVNANQPVQSASELPLTEMRSGHHLYLYFAVPRGTTIISYQVGAQQEDIEPPLVTN